LLAVGDLDALALQREQHGWLDRIDADRLAAQATLLELDADLASDVLGAAGLRGHRAAQRGDAGARASVGEPRVVELVVAGGRAVDPPDRPGARGRARGA